SGYDSILFKGLVIINTRFSSSSVYFPIKFILKIGLLNQQLLKREWATVNREQQIKQKSI
ncbi:hypothetical protein, partial [Nostoc parmelioides]|uniref:hypothetical protein n=1 Tax=Nostoc parmelioides TaxID=1521621 RepID=UPI001A7E9A9D